MIEAFSFQFLDYRLLPFRRFPTLQEIVEGGETLFQRGLGEVAQRFGDELAIFVEVFDTLRENASADAIDIYLSRGVSGRLG